MNCKKCGNPLDYEDTLDTYGGLDEGYLTEHQVWSCEHCQTDYIVDQTIEFFDQKPKVVYFEEA